MTRTHAILLLRFFRPLHKAIDGAPGGTSSCRPARCLAVVRSSFLFLSFSSFVNLYHLRFSISLIHFFTGNSRSFLARKGHFA